jgi:hypothetical protein
MSQSAWWTPGAATLCGAEDEEVVVLVGRYKKRA